MKKQTHKDSKMGALAVGVGVAALSAAAYVLFGPEGKQNRKQIKGWTVKMKGEIIEKFEKMQEVTEDTYHQVVDEVSDKYAKIKGMDQEDVNAVAVDLKKHWRMISRDAKKLVKSPKKPAKKAQK